METLKTPMVHHRLHIPFGMWQSHYRLGYSTRFREDISQITGFGKHVYVWGTVKTLKTIVVYHRLHIAFWIWQRLSRLWDIPKCLFRHRLPIDFGN